MGCVMGTRVGEICYSDVQQALDVVYSAEVPKVVPGPTPYMTYYRKDPSGWRMTTVRYEGSIPVLVSDANATLAIQPCDVMEPFNDGMQIAWALVLVAVIAWGIKKMREQVR